MSASIVQLDPRTGGLRRRVLGIYALLALLNVGAWLWALLAFHGQPLLLGTGLVAWGFGLRHAVDADHIAAIDNVTRKLMQDGARPVTVGLFFALGHSAVVVLEVAAVAATAAALEGRFEAWKALGGLVSTGVSALFLFLIAGMNIVILRGVFCEAVGTLNDNVNTLGFLIIGVFVAAWLASVLVYKLMRYDQLEVAAGPAPTP